MAWRRWWHWSESRRLDITTSTASSSDGRLPYSRLLQQATTACDEGVVLILVVARLWSSTRLRSNRELQNELEEASVPQIQMIHLAGNSSFCCHSFQGRTRGTRRLHCGPFIALWLSTRRPRSGQSSYNVDLRQLAHPIATHRPLLVHHLDTHVDQPQQLGRDVLYRRDLLLRRCIGSGYNLAATQPCGKATKTTLGALTLSVATDISESIAICTPCGLIVTLTVPFTAGLRLLPAVSTSKASARAAPPPTPPSGTRLFACPRQTSRRLPLLACPHADQASGNGRRAKSPSAARMMRSPSLPPSLPPSSRARSLPLSLTLALQRRERPGDRVPSSRASLRVGAGLRAFHCIYDEG
jgi:hypothetical protein